MQVTESPNASELSPSGHTRLAASDQFLRIDPSGFPDWDVMLTQNAESSFFHTSAWARVLQETYGHVPTYFCRFANGQLMELLATVEVSSRWTGRRGVSLAFTDFCAPLRAQREQGGKVYQEAMVYGRERGWRYLECRGNNREWQGSSPSLGFYRHSIDLDCAKEGLFNRLNGAVKRGILKAQKSSITIEFANDLDSIQIYYKLHCRTRRQHGVPPQPFLFFENIFRHVLLSGHGFVALARAGGKIVAAGVFFHHLKQAHYKFGASDYTFQHLRPNNLLMWEVIQRFAKEVYQSLDLGRTSLVNEGLRRFKLGFGAREDSIEYFKYDFVKQRFVKSPDRAQGWVNHLFRWCPTPWLRLFGQVLYPHLS